MTLPEAVRFAQTFPDVTEEPHHSYRSLRVAGKIFATWPPEATHLHVFLDPDVVPGVVAAAVAACPGSVAELWWGEKLAGIRVTLADADATVVLPLVEAAWRRRAPRRLVAAVDAERATPDAQR